MKPAFAILAAATLLLGASSAEAARPMGGNSNIIIARPPPLQSSLPPQANSGALNMPQPLGTPPVNTGTIGITSPSAWRSRPAKLRRAAGQSGIRDLRSERSPAQSGNSGSAIAPDEGSYATGVNTPSTNVDLCRQGA